jgi:predicted nuclease of restriction endonuclease-like (RecB) superfamily
MDQHQFLSKYLLEWPKKEQLEAFIQKEQSVETNKSDVGMSNNELNFGSLVSVIEQTHQHFQQQAVKAVNVSLTVRNWLVGYFIVTFEQKGEDRAAYGSKLLSNLAESSKNIKGFDERSFRNFRMFYKLYPHLQTYIASNLPEIPIWGSLTTELSLNHENEGFAIMQSLTTESKSLDFLVPAEKMVSQLSYSHIEQLLPIQDPLKRAFYELECIKGIWSVRELKRQINSLYFERCGMSLKPELLSEITQKNIRPATPSEMVKSVYVFEFLGLKVKDAAEEKDLETALLDHLQEFMLEMGHGFCFEYRQKRILIDDEYFFVDLVFYHRILKCHVIVELKIDAFKQEHMGQLNTYVAFYNAEVKREDDNPAIGILLCTEKGKKLVEYATAGMDQQLFVSKYLLELPKKEQLEAFIQKELEKLK